MSHAPDAIDLASMVGKGMAHAPIGSEHMLTLDRIYANMTPAKKAEADAAWSFERLRINHKEIQP